MFRAGGQDPLARYRQWWKPAAFWLLRRSTSLSSFRRAARRGDQDAASSLPAEIYPVTDRVARLGGDLKRTWSLKGQTLKLQDTLIAATALEHRMMMLTDNRKDFPMPELRFYELP